MASLHAAGVTSVGWPAPFHVRWGRLVAHQATRYYCVYHAHVCEGCRMVPPQQHTCHRGVTCVTACSAWWLAAHQKAAQHSMGL